MKSRVGTLGIVLIALCIWIPHAPLAAIRNQTPSAGIGTTNISVVAWCNKQAGTIEAALFSSSGVWSAATTISSGNGNAFHPLVALDNTSGNTAVVWIETDPTTKKYVVYGTFYTTATSWMLPPTQLSTSGRDVVPEDLKIAINTAHQALTNVDVIVTWSEYVGGDHVISAVLGIVKNSIGATPPSWSTPPQEGP